MLLAIIEHFNKRYPDNSIKFTLPPDNYYLTRAKYGTFQKADLRVKGINISFPFTLIPEKLRIKFGIILNKEIDVVIDASGFAYGDQWGEIKFRRRVFNNIAEWRTNKKIVFLPQAFGPFTGISFQNIVKEFLSSGFLVYAREETSFKTLNDINPGQAKLAPDFTCLLEAPIFSAHQNKKYGICFIPNHKMLVMRKDGNDYLEEMTQAIKMASQDGQKISFLLHEGIKDLELCNLLIKKAQLKDITILVSDDPLEIKYIISKCKSVVSSRFHGLVSALSQGIPAVATGWSHKYKHLMADYKSSHLMVENLSDLPATVSKLLDDEFIAQHTKVLNQCSKIQKLAVEQMWEQVDQYLELK